MHRLWGANVKIHLLVLSRIPASSSLYVCFECSDFWWESRDCEHCHKYGELVASPQQTGGCRIDELFGVNFAYSKECKRHLKNSITWV